MNRYIIEEAWACDDGIEFVQRTRVALPGSFLEQLERVYPGLLRADIVRDNGVSVRIIRQEDT